jgi:photosystem II stability/assembly factor-like uncharacterized protein
MPTMNRGKRFQSRFTNLLTLKSQYRQPCSACVVIACLVHLAPLTVRSDEKSTNKNELTPDTAATQRQTVLESFRHDASLADVCFIDHATGWAVGDRGVIWHTNDGGATWRQQSSTVTCRLSSVFFLDKQHGWVVGGEYEPFTRASRGVVLRTGDGGSTWIQNPDSTLPRLLSAKFFDGNRGIAIGESTATQPSGVFTTQDGGATWQPMPSNHAGSWLAGDFPDDESGAVAGYSGRFATLARRRILNSSTDLPSQRAFRAMRLRPPTDGWLVGDGGLALVTKDLGHSWQPPTGELPEFVTQHFDFHALAVIGQSVWIAGSPGTRIFHSPDSGQTWQTLETGQYAPIRAIEFLDADHGWAVGDFGNILATHDGGRSWMSQRTGARQAALLGIYADATNAPLEVLADNGAAEGYVTAVEILHTNPAESNDNRSHANDERTREALLLAGASNASTAWRFPLPAEELAHSPADLLADLNRATDGRAVEQIEQHLVRAIRMWRPEVIVSHNTKLETCEPRAAILAALLMQSIDAAADPAQHAMLASGAGLPPWQVKKVYALVPDGSRGAESTVMERFSPWLGTTLSNFVAPSRQLLEQTATKRDRYDFDLIASHIENTNESRGLFSGITFAADSAAQRPRPDLPVNDLAELKRMADRRRHLEALLKHTKGDSAWVAQINQAIEGVNADDGAELLFHLADGYRAAGRLDLAADTYYLLARRFPDQPLAAHSLEWLIKFYASSEASHCLVARELTNVRQAGLVTLPLPRGEGRGEGELVPQTKATIPGDSSPTIGLSRDDRLRRATKLAEYLRASRPDVFAQPSVRFAEVAALRKLGFAHPAKRYFLTLRQLPESNPWRRCGETEMWLSKPADLPPAKTLGACRQAAEPPRLDAQLTEPFWENADRLPLSDPERTVEARLRDTSDEPNAKTNSEVRLAYDQEYLYIAIHCPRSSGQDYSVPDEPRPRDADLSQHDRVALHIDVDRDFSTAFELAVDSRGWTHDACWGDAHWNPNWYVAHATDDDSWTVEAAVPISELVDDPPAARHVWAVSIYRTIPRAGYETWTGEPATDSPDQFGLLIFE